MIPFSEDGDWDLLDWTPSGTPIDDPARGFIAQIGSVASASRPGMIIAGAGCVHLRSEDGLMTDYVLPLQIPESFTFEFTAAIQAPTNAFTENQLLLSIGAQDRGGHAGLIFFSGNDDVAYLQTPPSGIQVNLGDAAAPMHAGAAVTFRMVVNGTTRVMDVYATVTSEIPTHGHKHRGTFVAVTADAAMDFLSVYAKGVAGNAAQVTIYSMGLSRKLLNTVRLCRAVINAQQAAGVNDRVVLNGLSSIDYGGLPLTYSWRVIDQPQGSNVVLPGMRRATADVGPVRFTARANASLGNGMEVWFDSGGPELKLSHLRTGGVDRIVITPRLEHGLPVSLVRDLLDALSNRSNPAYNAAVSALVTAAPLIPGDLLARLPVNDTDNVLSGGTWSTLPIVSFVPSVPGSYQFGLTVNNGQLTSLEAVVDVQVTSASLLTGYTPDASYLWTYLSDIWGAMRGKDEITTFWSALIQRVAAHLIDVLQAMDERSIATFPSKLLRRWEPVVLRESLPPSTLVTSPFEGCSYTIYPYGYPGHEEVTDKFTHNLPSVNFTVGSKLAWNGHVLTVISIRDDPSRTLRLYQVDQNVLPVYVVVSAGNGAHAVDNFENEFYTQHLGKSPIIEARADLFGTPSGTCYIDFDGAIREVATIAADKLRLMNMSEYVPVAKAHSPYWTSLDPQRVLFVAKASGAAGEGITATPITVIRGTSTDTYTLGSRMYSSLSGGLPTFDFAAAGIVPGDSVWIDAAVSEEYRVLQVFPDFLELDAEPVTQGPVATVTFYAEPGRMWVLPNSKAIQYYRGHHLPTILEVSNAINDPGDSRYCPAAHALVTVYYETGHEGDVIPNDTFTTSGSHEPRSLPWRLLQKAGPQTVMMANEIVFAEPWEGLPTDVTKPVDFIEYTSDHIKVAVANVLGFSSGRLLVGPPTVDLRTPITGDCQVNYKFVLTDNSAKFLRKGVSVGDTVVLRVGGLAPVQVTVAEVISNTQLQLSSELTLPPRTTVAAHYSIGSVVLPPDAVAESIVHTGAVPVGTTVVSMPYLQQQLVIDPVLLNVQRDPANPSAPCDPRLYEGIDYHISNGWLTFTPVLGTPGAKGPSGVDFPDRLWAEVVFYDNRETLNNNFGVVVGLPRSAFDETTASTSYLSAIRGLMFVLFRGPTMTNLRIGGQIFCNLPFAEAQGVVLDVDTNFDPANGISRIAVQDWGGAVDSSGRPLMNQNALIRYYTFPSYLGVETNPATGAPLAAGDTVPQFQPLCKGVQIQDYVSDPAWFHGAQFLDRAAAVPMQTLYTTTPFSQTPETAGYVTPTLTAQSLIATVDSSVVGHCLDHVDITLTSSPVVNLDVQLWVLPAGETTPIRASDRQNIASNSMTLKAFYPRRLELGDVVHVVFSTPGTSVTIIGTAGLWLRPPAPPVDYAVARAFNEVQKYHVFQVQVDSGLLTQQTSELLTTFVKTVKPAHTEVAVGITRGTTDEVDLTLEMSSAVRAQFRDDRYTCEDSWYVTALSGGLLQLTGPVPPEAPAIVGGDVLWVDWQSSTGPNHDLSTSVYTVVANVGGTLEVSPPGPSPADVLPRAVMRVRGKYAQPMTAGYVQQNDHYDGAARLPLSYDGSSGGLPFSWTRVYGVGTTAGSVLTDPVASFVSNGLKVGDIVFAWDDAGNYEFFPVVSFTQTTLTVNGTFTIAAPRYDVGPKVSGPPAVVDAHLRGMHRTLLNNPGRQFDHVCNDVGRGHAYKDRQKAYYDRLLRVGPECLVDARVCTYITGDAVYPTVRLSSSGVLFGNTITDTDVDFLDGSGNYIRDVRPGCFVYLDPDGTSEWIEIDSVGVHTITLASTPVHAPGVVAYRVLPRLGGIQAGIDRIKAYSVPQGGFPRYDTIFRYDQLKRHPDSRLNPDDYPNWKGPRPVVEFLLNSVPNFDTGFYTWSDVKVSDFTGTTPPYFDRPPTGPGQNPVTRLNFMEPRWEYNPLTATVLSGVVACSVKSLSNERGPQPGVSKYPSPLPVEIEMGT